MLCRCGCGRITTIYRGNSRNYISGHSNRCLKLGYNIVRMWESDILKGNFVSIKDEE